MDTHATASVPAEMLPRLRAFYLGESRDEYSYRYLARRIKDDGLRRLLESIADIEHRHAAFWRSLLERQGETVPPPRYGRLRLLLLGLLLRWVNPMLVISSLELGETAAYEEYYRLYRDASLDPALRSRLRSIIIDELEHESAFRQARSRSGFDNIRDFILGMNDGLVEILGAVTGLSAAYAGNPLMVAVSGLVVGVAGALSMGIGAFVSVRSQRQVDEARNQRNEILFGVAPQRALDEFAETLNRSGIPEALSRQITRQLEEEPQAVARMLRRESDEDEWRSAWFTGLAYLFGVLFPVVPYFFAERASHAMLGSFLLAGLALASVGGLVAIVSGISITTKIREMLLSGFTAAGLAWLFGQLMQGFLGIQI